MKRVDRRLRLVVAAVVALCLAAVLVGADFPRPSGWVVDAAGVLTAGEQQQIEAIAQSLKDSTGAELAVVTVTSTDGLGSKAYAVELFERWGIGEKGKDTGVLLLLVTGDERSVEIEVGYGLEPIITDGAAGRILDEHVVPALRDGQPGHALTAGAEAIAERVRAGLAGESAETDELSETSLLALIVVAFAALLVLAVLFALLAFVVYMLQRRCPQCRSRVQTRQEVVQPATRLAAGTAVLHYTCRQCGWTGTGNTVRIPPTGGYSGPSPGGWGGGTGGGFGGSGRSGGSRGGFGGFGGGRSGGGGAGRRW